MPHIPDWQKQIDFDYKIIVDQQSNATLVGKYVNEQGWTIPCYVNANSELKQSLGFHSLRRLLSSTREVKSSSHTTASLKSEDVFKVLQRINKTNK